MSPRSNRKNRVWIPLASFETVSSPASAATRSHTTRSTPAAVNTSVVSAKGCKVDELSDRDPDRVRHAAIRIANTVRRSSALICGSRPVTISTILRRQTRVLDIQNIPTGSSAPRERLGRYETASWRDPAIAAHRCRFRLRADVGNLNGDTSMNRLMPLAVFLLSTTIPVDAIAETYWQICRQHPSAWTQEIDLRPSVEEF